MFASFPRWTSLAAPSVMEAMPGGSFEPYPGNRWNEWQPGAPAHDRIVSSHAVFADSSNNLWVRRRRCPARGIPGPAQSGLERVCEAQGNHRVVLETVKALVELGLLGRRVVLQAGARRRTLNRGAAGHVDLGLGAAL